MVTKQHSTAKHIRLRIRVDKCIWYIKSSVYDCVQCVCRIMNHDDDGDDDNVMIAIVFDVFMLLLFVMMLCLIPL